MEHDPVHRSVTPDTTPMGVMVLGMHRSGTSAATRLVNLLGLSMCISEDLLVGTRTNAKGHWESRSLFRFNNKLLGDMGRTWWYPPSVQDLRQWELSLPEATFAEARAVFDRAHPTAPWVWKDPRTCLTLSFWRHALRRPVAGVVVFRNPLEIADSLERRDKMEVEFSLALWMRYTRVLLEQANGMPLLVSRYDEIVRDPEGWSETAREYLSGLGVAVHPQIDITRIREFVDPKLRHSSYSPADLDASISTGSSAVLYDALQELTGSHGSFVAPTFETEPAWVEEQLAAVGPEWRSTWKEPGTPPPTVSDRFRALMKRAASIGR
jgi:hypothetical protein